MNGRVVVNPAIGISQQKYEIKDAHSKKGIPCKACHGEKSPPQSDETAVCLACHKSYEEGGARTKALTPNPHESHQGKVACSDCHSTHGNSKLSCNESHIFQNFKMK